jgi:hypothetical protein
MSFAKRKDAIAYITQMMENKKLRIARKENISHTNCGNNIGFGGGKRYDNILEFRIWVNIAGLNIYHYSLDSLEETRDVLKKMDWKGIKYVTICMLVEQKSIYVRVDAKKITAEMVSKVIEGNIYVLEELPQAREVEWRLDWNCEN